MMLLTDVPDEVLLPDAVGAVSSHDGEVLQQLVDAPAGAWTAVVLEGIDPARLSPFDLPAYLRACARVQAWAGAQLAAGVALLAATPEVTRPDTEVAIALSEPIGAAQRRVWQSKRLRRFLPGAWRRMADGELSERHVGKLVEVTSAVTDPELLAKVEERVLARAAGKTADELARHAKDVLKRLDPTGSQRRAKAARDAADVVFEPRQDGMADVIVHQPVEDAAIVKTAVDAYAATCKAAGDGRPVGVLRAEATVTWASSFLSGLADGHVPRAAGRRLEVGVTLPLRAALGLDDLPGEVPGLGIIPREVIAQMIRTELPRLRLMVIDEASGRLLHRAESTYRPTPEQVAQVRATYVFSVGPGSKVLATRTDTDHVVPHPVGPTAIGNLVPLDRTWHRAKTHTPLSVTVDDNGAVTTTTVSGQTRTVTPYDHRMHPDDGLTGDVTAQRADPLERRSRRRVRSR